MNYLLLLLPTPIKTQSHKRQLLLPPLQLAHLLLDIIIRTTTHFTHQQMEKTRQSRLLVILMPILHPQLLMMEKTRLIRLFLLLPTGILFPTRRHPMAPKIHRPNKALLLITRIHTILIHRHPILQQQHQNLLAKHQQQQLQVPLVLHPLSQSNNSNSNPITIPLHIHYYYNNNHRNHEQPINGHHNDTLLTIVLHREQLRIQICIHNCNPREKPKFQQVF
jgi:hypothetical protein